MIVILELMYFVMLNAIRREHTFKSTSEFKQMYSKRPEYTG